MSLSSSSSRSSFFLDFSFVCVTSLVAFSSFKRRFRDTIGCVCVFESWLVFVGVVERSTVNMAFQVNV